MSKEPPKPLDLGLRGIPFRMIDPETGEALWVTKGTPEEEALLAKAARYSEQVQREAERKLHQDFAQRRRPLLQIFQGGKKG